MFSLFGPFGPITNPFTVLAPGTDYVGSTEGEGIIVLITALIRMMVLIAGLYAFLNIILAGYGFLSAAGDQKAIQKAQERIWRSVLGLAIVAGAFILAGIIGYIIYGAANWDLLFNPQIIGPP